MIAVDERPITRVSPGEGSARRRAVVSRGLRVYLRTLAPEDLEHLFQYPRGKDVPVGLIRHWPNHANHVHVRFKSSKR